MEPKEKKPITLYLELLLSEQLDAYCFLAKRNKTVVLNAAVKDYLKNRLQSEYKNLQEGFTK